MRPDRQRGDRGRREQEPACSRIDRRRRAPRARATGRRARAAQRHAGARRAVLSGRPVDRRSRDHRRHDRQQLVRRAFHPVRQHGAQRDGHRRGLGRRHARTLRRDRRRRTARASGVSRAGRTLARHRRARERRNRGPLSESLAPRRRLQSRCDRGRTVQRGEYPGRLRGDAGVLHQHRTRVAATPGASRPRRRALPTLRRRHGSHQRNRRDGPRRGRTRRRHDARPGAPERRLRADDRTFRARGTRRRFARRIQRRRRAHVAGASW